MKRYKLKKDLKNIDAGAHFYVDNDGDLVCPWNNPLTIPGKIFEIFPGLLEEYFEQISDEPKTVEDIHCSDSCYIIEHCMTEVCYRKIKYNPNQHLGARSVGDIVLTKDDAKKELARRKAKQILIGDTRGFNPDWEDDAAKYEVYYDYDENSLYTECYCECCGHPDLWFATREDAEASIKAHPNEWKTYLGVEG